MSILRAAERATYGEDASLAIAGAGVAGLAAFIQARRLGIEPVVIEERLAGGALIGGRLVENYPGVRACTGGDLAGRMVSQAEAMGLNILHDRVEELDAVFPWRLNLASGKRISARAVILATGQKPAVPAPLKPLEGTGVLLFPAMFDPGEWRGRSVVVIGGGDVAFDQALLLADNGAIAEIVCRSAPRCLPALRREALLRGIRLRQGYSPSACSYGPPLSLTFETAGRAGALLKIDAEGALVAVGRRPAPPKIRLPNGAAFDIGPPAPGDALPAGLFLAGDLNRGNVRQAVVAAGDGCAAAIAAFDYLRGQRASS